MAGKAKGACLAGTIEYDGKRYAPGMPVPLPKDEAVRLTNKLGAWEGDPVEGDPVVVRRATPRRTAPVATAGGSSGPAMVVMTQEQLDGVVEALSQDVAAQIAAVLEGLDKVITGAAAAGAEAVIAALNEGEEPAGEQTDGDANPEAASDTSVPATDAKAS